MSSFLEVCWFLGTLNELFVLNENLFSPGPSTPSTTVESSLLVCALVRTCSGTNSTDPEPLLAKMVHPDNTSYFTSTTDSGTHSFTTTVSRSSLSPRWRTSYTSWFTESGPSAKSRDGSRSFYGSRPLPYFFRPKNLVTKISWLICIYESLTLTPTYLCWRTLVCAKFREGQLQETAKEG